MAATECRYQLANAKCCPCRTFVIYMTVVVYISQSYLIFAQFPYMGNYAKNR